MINFCHITPTGYLSLVEKYPVHLLLAHLVEENKQYREFYQQLKKTNPLVYYHLDNSGFEMFQRNQPMYPSSKLIEMAHIVGADSIVMSDYPNERFSKTIQAAEKLIPVFKKEGFQTFFCPQSQTGKLYDLIESFEWAINNEDINFIGLSILACPNALGLLNSADKKDWTARKRILDVLSDRGLLDKTKTFKRLHCLGMSHGPNEIQLLRDYHDYIFSWDSSSAAWHGIHNITYDDSLTGLVNGKLQTEVDFNIHVDPISIANIEINMSTIDRMCE